MEDENVIHIRKPEVRGTAGGLIDETRLTLSVHGEDLEPNDVTTILECMPSHSHRRGDLRGHNVPPWPKGAWLLSVEGRAPTEPDHLLASLLDRIPSDPVVWEDLRRRWSVGLGFGLFQEAWNRGFCLSPETLRRVAALGLSLDFDIYAAGVEEDGRGR